MKICNKCKKTKDDSEFGKNCNCLRSWCKDCVNENSCDRYASNPDKYRAQRKKWKKENPIKVKYGSYKTRGFINSYEDWLKIVMQPCYYCGNIDSPCNGVDRMNSKKGYEKENCVPCCSMCNTMKLAYTKEELIMKCKQILNRHGGN